MILLVCGHRTARRRCHHPTGIVVPSTRVDTDRNWGVLQSSLEVIQILAGASTTGARRGGIGVASDNCISTLQGHVSTIDGGHLCRVARCSGAGRSQALRIRIEKTVGKACDSLQVLIGALGETTVAAIATLSTSAWSAAGDLLRRQFNRESTTLVSTS